MICSQAHVSQPKCPDTQGFPPGSQVCPRAEQAQHIPVQCIDALYVPKEGADLLWLQEPRSVNDLQEVVLHGERYEDPAPLGLITPNTPHHTLIHTAFYGYDTISQAVSTLLSCGYLPKNSHPLGNLERNLIWKQGLCGCH